MVATIAVPVKGAVVQQWMCDAVVPASRLLNDASTDNVFATSSVITVADPVPGDAFGGDSAGPERFAPYVIIVAWLAEIGSMSAPIMATTGERYRTTVSFDFM
jgi:hypothetical protein